jgi:hypothetical protein
MERITVTSTPIFTHKPAAIAETALSYKRSDDRQADFSFIERKDAPELSMLIALIASDLEYAEGSYHQILELSVEEVRLVRNLLNMPQIANLLEVPPVRSLDDLLDLALIDIELNRSQIVGDVFFSIENGCCEIWINDMHVSLCDLSLEVRDLRDCDWHVVDAGL